MIRGIVLAENVMDFSRNFKKYYNTKDKKMNEAVKLTQQILLGNVGGEIGSGVAGVETRSMKKASAQKTAEKKEPTPTQQQSRDPTCKKLFQEEGEEMSVAELTHLKEVNESHQKQKSIRDHAWTKELELELRKHSLAVLDSVVANYNLTDRKLQEIQKTLENINPQDYSYASMVNSWVGRYLQLIHFLFQKSSQNTVSTDNLEKIGGYRPEDRSGSLKFDGIHSIDLYQL